MEKTGSFAEILDLPFFTLEYHEGIFKRLIPNKAKDLGDGLFKWEGKLYRLPSGVNEALAQKTIQGRPLLSLLNRGKNPLIKEGPGLASGSEHLTELRLLTQEETGASASADITGSLTIEIHFPSGGPENSQWLPLTGLPHHRYFKKIIWEIINKKTMEELIERWGEKPNLQGTIKNRPGSNMRFVLKGRDIPHFVDEYGLLIFQFGDNELKTRLSADLVFADRGDLSLVLVGEKKDEKRLLPFLEWKDQRYPAEEVSLHMTSEYIRLEPVSGEKPGEKKDIETTGQNPGSGRRWVRREDLQAAGIFPLCSFAGGMPIDKEGVEPEVFFRQSGLRPGNQLPATVPAADLHLTGEENSGQNSKITILPPEPETGNRSFKYSVNEKFSGLSGPSLYSELALLNTEGKPAPFVPLRLLKGSLNIERMDRNERSYYLYWRTEFRRGNLLESNESYIRIFARELCLFTGDEDSVTQNFSLMLKLWQQYRGTLGNLDNFLPRWLVDYMAVYEIRDFALPLLLPFAKDLNDPLLGDIYVYSRFIAENNAIDFSGIRYLLPKTAGEDLFLNNTQPHHYAFDQLIKDFETAINAIDRYLRQEFKLNLFEFFCPPASSTEKREAFSGMERAGSSSYSVTGIRFSMHRPLLNFLENLFNYTEFLYRAKNSYVSVGKSAKKPPNPGEPWKSIADTILGQETGSRGFSGPLSHYIKLEKTNLKKIRTDADAVRELLSIEEEKPEKQQNGNFELFSKTDLVQPSAPIKGTIPQGGRHIHSALKHVLKSLTQAELEAIRIISSAGENPYSALEELARKHNTMPELIIDRINSAFLEQTGDLLIDMVDKKPQIHPEYHDEFTKAAERGDS